MWKFAFFQTFWRKAVPIDRKQTNKVAKCNTGFIAHAPGRNFTLLLCGDTSPELADLSPGLISLKVEFAHFFNDGGVP